MAFQVLAPPFTAQEQYSLPGSLQPAPNPSMHWVAIASNILHSLCVPIAPMFLLKQEVEHLLDSEHHAAVTYAVLTAGYRLH